MHGAETNYLIDILALLLATVVIIPIFHAAKLGAILGYLTAGVILGPWGFGIVTEIDEIRHLGEFGVIFLLFILGIELKPDKLWKMRHLVIGLGLSQLLITATIIFLIAVGLGIDKQSAIIVGFGLALSSTALCLQLLAERGGITTTMGRMSFSVLLLQDLAVVPLLALVSIFAGGDVVSDNSSPHFFYALVAILGLLVVGRYLLNPVLKRIVASHDPEVFIAMAMLLVLGVAWLMEAVGLSMALGAFLAGLMLAESHFRHQIEADILPFRGILLGLFFMTVGMGIDFGLLWSQMGIVIALTLGLMTVKTLIVYCLARISGAHNDISVQTAVLLSQSGEFGFIMFGFAVISGVIEAQLGQTLTLIIALTMVLTPFVVKASNALLLRFYTTKDLVEGETIDFEDETEHHVILAGFGRVGARIGAILSAADVPYVAIDMSQVRVQAARAQGFPVFYGDACNMKLLKSIGIERARMLVVALDDPEHFDRMVPLIRQGYPNIPIHVRAKDRQHCADLTQQGASSTVSETLETSLRLTEEVLLGSGVDASEAQKLVNEFRQEYYSGVVQKVTENTVVMGELRHK
ncbi:MAG: cation:proton antiporter [Proteobacteria bacterium]|nr:cation:proton antiporter [Pseudomonadota bacterium]